MQLASKLRMLDALSRQNAEAVAEVANKGKEITQLTTQIEVFVTHTPHTHTTHTHKSGHDANYNRSHMQGREQCFLSW